MDPVQFWKGISPKKNPGEAELKEFLGLDDKTLGLALLKSLLIPADVAATPQIIHGLEWGLPREFASVRKGIDNPVVVEQEATEGLDDLAADDSPVTFADRAAQELLIFKGMISQRLKMLSSGAIDELRPVLEKR